MTIYEIIQSIAKDSSTKTKQQILENNKDNEVLKLCFLYAENPRFNFYIRGDEKPFSIESSGSGEITLDTFKELDQIIQRNVTGNFARLHLCSILSKLSNEARVIVNNIVNRDLRCGAGTSIANKVWKNLIPTYPMMLCSKFDAKSEKYLKQFENNIGFISQKKSDGGRCLVKVDSDGNVTYHSRNGSTLNLFGVFDDQFSKYPNTMFDGELLVKTSNGVASRTESNGNYTRAVRNTLTKEQASKFCIDLWDMIPEDEFNAGLGTEPYNLRLSKLSSIIFDKSKVNIVESVPCKTIDECITFYEKMRSQGEEGSIIKTANSVFEDTRSKNSVKLKAECTGECLVTDIEEGTGKYVGMIGSLVCQSSCGQIKFNVGTGLTDDDRGQGIDHYLNKIVEIKFNEIISSKNKTTKSLFLPVYICVRYDKNIANTLEELL